VHGASGSRRLLREARCQLPREAPNARELGDGCTFPQRNPEADQPQPVPGLLKSLEFVNQFTSQPAEVFAVEGVDKGPAALDATNDARHPHLGLTQSLPEGHIGRLKCR
jgi:hypothetical protein